MADPYKKYIIDVANILYSWTSNYKDWHMNKVFHIPAAWTNCISGLKKKVKTTGYYYWFLHHVLVKIWSLIHYIPVKIWSLIHYMQCWKNTKITLNNTRCFCTFPSTLHIPHWISSLSIYSILSIIR